MTSELAIDVSNLSFAHRKDVEQSLVNLALKLPTGSRTLLIGANGAGKSTLLQILAGKRLTPEESKVLIKGADVFRKPHPGVTFLGTEWAMNPVVRGDIQVSNFLDSVGGYRYKERRDKLLDILDVDLDWRMHEISDGERRRVQLVMGLMSTWDILLLDEVTVDLDVLVRDDLLTFLMGESETRGATILYATHIFDGLNNFPTHVAHMRFGEFVQTPQRWVPPLPGGRAGPHLHEVALQWLKDDRDYRRGLEKKGRKVRGARKDDVPTDSETFYRKYDYNH
ncbi:P-loop containing nucleoside triphosphate hydrolase protein [Schizopora paradoxa]|uniref:p-loop containing nucleoside triphosphate hydrolase protein n=1 Tax=Schizopora paradoxa TaxID=27342 RepID=A0A0H2RVG2_9AGAM|nr:P-loop containing nucleoside triphosphate hydrolase protein [Schizopora paradoxa]